MLIQVGTACKSTRFQVRMCLQNKQQQFQPFRMSNLLGKASKPSSSTLVRQRSCEFQLNRTLFRSGTRCSLTFRRTTTFQLGKQELLLSLDLGSSTWLGKACRSFDCLSNTNQVGKRIGCVRLLLLRIVLMWTGMRIQLGT